MFYLFTLLLCPPYRETKDWSGAPASSINFAGFLPCELSAGSQNSQSSTRFIICVNSEKNVTYNLCFFFSKVSSDIFHLFSVY